MRPASCRPQGPYLAVPVIQAPIGNMSLPLTALCNLKTSTDPCWWSLGLTARRQYFLAASIPQENRWHGRLMKHPRRSQVSFLTATVKKLAAATILARHWPAEGSRQETALALCGGLLRAGWEVQDVKRFVAAVAEAAGDNEVQMRANAAESTSQKAAADQPTTGWPTLVQVG